MVRDLQPTLEGIRRAVEEYGSLAHLADATGVSAADLLAWYRGETKMPLETYQRMLTIVSDWKSRPR